MFKMAVTLKRWIWAHKTKIYLLFYKIISVYASWYLTFSKYMAGVQQISTFMDNATVWVTDVYLKWDFHKTK